MPFIPFSPAHLAGLGFTVVLLVVILAWRKRIRAASHHQRTVRYVLAGILIGCELSLYAWYTLTDNWGLHSLPIQLCSLTLWLSVIVLFTRHRRLYEITFFLGTLGAIQAILTPNLDVSFPHFRYFHFFLAHAVIIGVSLYLTAVERYRPRPSSMGVAYVALHLLAIPAVVVNGLTGSNFMFLARKPDTPSLLDLLAPWPWYLLQLELIVIALIAWLYLVVRIVDRIAKLRFRKQRRNTI